MNMGNIDSHIETFPVRGALEGEYWKRFVLRICEGLLSTYVIKTISVIVASLIIPDAENVSSDIVMIE